MLYSKNTGLFFDFDSDALRSETRSNLQKLATSLKEYDDTEVNVLGHTDSQGSSAYNKTLSTRRATSVENYLALQGVPGTRIHPKGYGESDPVADNETESGRQLNRRVEIVIIANDELKRSAKDGSVK
jgi:outer membrane protein OmpA-like peptidoglycan-associated protein